MMTYITPNEQAGKTDSERIRAAVRQAAQTGVGRVRIPRLNERTGEELWVIDEPIALPSDMEILIDDAHLMLAEGKYLNMFTIGAPGQPEETRNVTLRGRGRATLDGGVYNGLSEKNSARNGLPHISKNTTLLFFNASDLLVENLRIIRQRWWAVTNIFVHHSVFRNLWFEADYSRIDENGVHHPDELPRRYREIYVKNADGIDLRIGCHDILIENISGFTEDDSVALTALGGFERALGYVVEGLSPDIHDVQIKGVATDTVCSNVRLLNDNGNKLYNILVDGVVSPRRNESYRAHSTVRIGDMVYADRHSVPGETHHITVRNVVSESTYGVSLCKALCDSVIENVTALEGYGVSTYKDYEASLYRCRIGNILSAAKGIAPIRYDGLTLHDCEVSE